MENISFETALAALEDIVKKLELGTLPLEESLKAYEEGIALVRVCNERLEDAKARVSILSCGPDGIVTDAPFIQGEENAN